MCWVNEIMIDGRGVGSQLGTTASKLNSHGVAASVSRGGAARRTSWPGGPQSPYCAHVLLRDSEARLRARARHKAQSG